jgi:hypothetical protein
VVRDFMLGRARVEKGVSDVGLRRLGIRGDQQSVKNGFT